MKFTLRYTYKNSLDQNEKSILTQPNFSNLVEFLNLTSFLSYVYLYIYTLSNSNQHILLCNNKLLKLSKIRRSSFLSENYYEGNKKNSRSLIHSSIIEDKLLTLKWLRYFTYISLFDIKKRLSETPLITYRKLYMLTYKLNKKYKGMRNINIIPHTIIFLTKSSYTSKEKFVNFFQFHRTILSISPNHLYFVNNNYSKQLKAKNLGFHLLNYIFNIITTATLHGRLF